MLYRPVLFVVVLFITNIKDLKYNRNIFLRFWQTFLTMKKEKAMKKRNCCFRQFKVHHVQLSRNGKTLLESDRTMNFVVIVLVMEVYSGFKKMALCSESFKLFF